MLVLGLILLIVGCAIAYFFPERLPRFVGAVVALLGLLLVIFGVLDAGDVDLEHAWSSWSRSA